MKKRLKPIQSQKNTGRGQTKRHPNAGKRTARVADSESVSVRQSLSGAPASPPIETKHDLGASHRLRHRMGALVKAIRHHLPATAAALVGGLLTLLAVQVAADRELVRTRHEFDTQAEHHLAVASKAIDRSMSVINAAAGFFSGSQPADRWAFGKFVTDILPVRPGLRSVQWLPRVPAAQREEYERRAARVDGLAGFRIVERDSQWRPVPAASRDEYFPVYYAEPFKDNADRLGEDMLAYPAYRTVMEAARDSGEMRATLQRAVETATGPQVALIVFQPVYRNDAPTQSTDQRRKALVGFVTGEFLIGDMIDAAVREYTTPARIDLYVIDAGDGVAPNLDEPYVVYYGAAAVGGRPDRSVGIQPEPGQLVSEEVWLVADRTWTLSVRSADTVGGAASSPTVWAIGFAGLALTALLSLYLATLTNRNRAIEHAVAARTAELSTANRSLYEEISRRRRIEGELRNAKDQAEVANHAKSAFLAMISHELRTPLNAILGFSEVMSEEIYGPVGNDRYRNYLRDISQSGQHLLGLINNILDLSKVEANEFSLSEEWLDLASLVDETVRLIERKAEEAKLSIETDVPDSLPALWADARAVRQILINLLSNAVKFTPAGGRVTIAGTCDESSRIVLSISDTGIGIPQEHQKRIFQPFTQVDTSLARKFDGTGLGLPLTRSLAELHRARLMLRSISGKGTSVTIYFPASRTFGAAHTDYVEMNV